MKFRIKITLCMVGILSLLFGTGGSLLISLSFQNALEREKDVAYNAYQMVLGTIQIVNDLDQQWDYEDISDTIEQLYTTNSPAWAALRLATAERNIYESGATAYITRPARLPEPGTCVFYYEEGAPGRQLLMLAGAIEVGKDTLYLYTAQDISFLYETRRQQQQTYLGTFAAMALLCAALSYSAARMLTAPLEGLSRAAHAIAAGQFSSRVPVRTRDEIGAVSQNFNCMAARMEGTISQLQDVVERQERFIGSFTHEIKTPMTSIIGYADLLRSDTLTGEERAEAANYIFTEGRRLENLSQKLLHLLVLQHGELPFTAVRPADLVNELAAQLAPIYLSQGIALSWQCEDGTCLLEPALVRSLLLNLLDNARKSLEQGGAIAIVLTMRPDGCRIQIRDNGRGVPAEALPHVTEAFYRVDASRARKQGGAGLGLALCREIVRLHRGVLTLESPPGEGLCVTAELRGGSA